MGLYTKIIDLQKLEAGLQKVAKNKPTAGVDGITYDMFLENKREYLKQLHLELAEHRYHPLPVKLVSLYKGEKERQVALYSMRDKVVQQSIASELQKIYEPVFCEGTFAYRNGRSALQAVEKMEKYLCECRTEWVLKLDIQNFFDSISAEKLRNELKRVIREEDVLELIMENAQAESLQKGGEIVRKSFGIWQGSGIAPILSNIYLKDFDYEMSERTKFFVRYSDDILIVAEDKDAACELLRFTEVYMQERGLSLNDRKSQLIPVDAGVDFLGYHFDGNGKSVPLRAEINLQERLESLFLTASGLSTKEKLKKGAEILEGWEQYYREERSICSIQEYAVVLYMVQNKEDALQKIGDMRPNYQNTYRELAEYMLAIWKKRQRTDLELLEYEQLYEIDEVDKGRIHDYDSPFVKELLANFEKLCIYEEENTLMELIQDYTELQCLNKASKMMERCQKLQTTEKKLLIPEKGVSQENAVIDSGIKRLLYELFVGREDTYSEESMANRRVVEQRNEPLTEDVLEEHLSGQRTIGTYVQRPNGTAKYLVIDMDVSKKILFKHTVDSPEFSQYIKLCSEMTGEIIKILHRLGLQGYMENSAYRGYHIWIFFTEWIPVRYINALSRIIAEKFNQNQKEEISMEFFPDDRRVRTGKAGQSIRIPLGMNPRSGRISYFLDENLGKVTELSSYLKGIARFSLTAIKRIIGMHMGKTGECEFGTEKQNVLDRDLEEFGKLNIEVRTVLEKCNLMCYLCQKAKKTGYLPHGERLSILYVFGHMG